MGTVRLAFKCGGGDAEYHLWRRGAVYIYDMCVSFSGGSSGAVQVSYTPIRAHEPVL
ncbi:MAG: hypothetical protein K2I96_01765 [Lachnospiraceae bacterium]|nr:hypothetical protein [Lachnospiraceae bacterium]